MTKTLTIIRITIVWLGYYNTKLPSIFFTDISSDNDDEFLYVIPKTTEGK